MQLKFGGTNVDPHYALRVFPGILIPHNRLPSVVKHDIQQAGDLDFDLIGLDERRQVTFYIVCFLFVELPAFEPLVFVRWEGILA